MEQVSKIGIKCDNPKCDYRYEDVTYDEMESWLNKPCPKCGENLLTQKDLDALNTLYLVEKAMLTLSLKDKKLQKALGIGSKKTRVIFHGNGFENVEIEEVDIPKEHKIFHYFFDPIINTFDIMFRLIGLRRK